MASYDDEASLYAKEDEGEDEEAFGGKEHILFLIDTSPSMFDTQTEYLGRQMSTFEVAVDAVQTCMKRKVITSARDEFALILYNTAKTNEAISKYKEENVFVFIDRDVPSVNEIQALNVLGDVKFKSEIGTYAGGASPGVENLEKAFTVASEMAQNGRVTKKGKSILPKPRIFLFTNEEIPEGADSKGYKEKLVNRVQNLKEMEAALDVFPICSVLRKFDFSLFWREMKDLLPDEEGYDSLQGHTVGSVDERMQALFDSLQKHMEKRRSMGSVLMNIPGGVSIAIQLFKLTVATGTPKSVFVHAQTNELIVPKTRHVLSSTGSHVATTLEEQTQMRKEYKKVYRLPPTKDNPNREMQAVFEPEEVARELKGLYGEGMELLGFKPLSFLQDYHNLTTSTFIRPDERKAKGSITAFKALLDAMLAQGKMAVCRYTHRAGTTKMVALLPQALEQDAFGYQISPEGMHMTTLPFADDIRTAEGEAQQTQEVPESHIQLAATCIERQRYDYRLGQVPDPALHHHFNVLEAMALGKEPPTLEESREQDATVVPSEDIDAEAGLELQEFKNQVLGEDYVPYKAVAGKGVKRAWQDDAGLATAYANVPWADLIKAGVQALETKLTADKLKLYLSYHKLPLSGIKKDLAVRIYKHATKE